MKVVGIIAEYNPFHKGHEYQIQKLKEKTGADYVIIAMSGNFLQRGAPALCDKFTRTEMALRCGADLVLELPVLWATASAEYFAQGGVHLLVNTGVVTHLGFGAETEDLHGLLQVSSILKKEPDAYRAMLNSFIRSGSPFPVARKHALATSLPQFSTEKLGELLDSPNNVLALEYLKALPEHISPVLIPRKGAGYHSTDIHEVFPSATAIRETIFAKTKEMKTDFITDIVSAETDKHLIANPASAESEMDLISNAVSAKNNMNSVSHAVSAKNNMDLVSHAVSTKNNMDLISHAVSAKNNMDLVSHAVSAKNNMNLVSHAVSAKNNMNLVSYAVSTENNIDLVSNAMPAESYKLLQDFMEKYNCMETNDFSSMLGYRLLSLSKTDYSVFADCSRDLSNKIKNHLNDYITIEDFIQTLKSKDMTYTRISRCLLHILLNTTQADYSIGRAMDYAPYLRVLGFKKDSSEVLSAIKRKSGVPLITKVADASSILDCETYKMFENDLFASALYYQCMAGKSHNKEKPLNEFTHPLVII